MLNYCLNSKILFGITLLCSVVLMGGVIAQAEEQVTITWANHLTAEEAFKAGCNNVVKEFTERNPGIRVEVIDIPWGEIKDQLVIRVASGTAPDSATVFDPWIPTYAAMGALEPLDSLYTEELEAYLFPGGMAACKYRQHFVAVPMYDTTHLLWYNPDLFEKSGLDPDIPPRTWADLRTYGQKITSIDKNIFGVVFPSAGTDAMVYTLAPFVFQAGGSIVGSDYEVNIDEPPAKKALSFLKKLIEEGIAPRGTDIRTARDMLGLGRAGMQLGDGPWVAGIVSASYPGTRVTPAEVVSDVQKGNIHSGCANVIFKQSRKKKEAIKFLKFWLTEYAQKQVFQMLGSAATREAYQDAIKENPLYKPVFEGVKYAQPTFPPLPEVAQLETILGKELDLVYTGEKSVEEALEDAAERMRTVLGIY